MTSNNPEGTMTELSAFLKALRNKTDKSIREVELGTGLSNAYISQIETGKAKKPTPEVLHKLAEYYHCSYEELMRYAGYITGNKEAEHDPDQVMMSALIWYGMRGGNVEKAMYYIKYLKGQQ